MTILKYYCILLLLLVGLLWLTGCTPLHPQRPPTPHELETIEMYKRTGQEARVPVYWREIREREKK